MGRVHRRGFVVAAGTAALAGCLGFGGTDEVVGVTLRNRHDEEHRLSVTVRFDGDVLVEETATLAPDQSTDTEFDNPGPTGDATVEVVVDERDPVTEDVSVGGGSGIRSLTVEVTADGEVSVFAGRT